MTGTARYAAEASYDDLAYGVAVTATVGKGRIDAIDVDPVAAMPGVASILHHQNAPRLADAGDPTLRLLQDDRVPHFGHVVALVVADTLEHARAGADALRVQYDEEPPDVVFAADHPDMYAPDHVNPAFATDVEIGDVDAGLAAADVLVEATYSTPVQQNNAMEPHATTARWVGDQLTVHDSNQGATSVKQSLSTLFGLDADQVHVLSEHVGGGFGSKGTARPPVVLASMASRQLGRPVRVVLTRQQMYHLVGYRTPTIQEVRLGADRDGRLTALDHLAYSQTSTVLEFAEQTSTITRVLYQTDALRSRHRLVALDVPTPRWMRAPGEAPGSFALESAMDELAEAAGIDPVELRIVNDAATEPGVGSRRSAAGTWSPASARAQPASAGTTATRDPGNAREGHLLLGTGVASATYPARSAAVDRVRDG